MWEPDPERSIEADSPVRASIDLLEELPTGTWRFARLQGGLSELRTAAAAVVPSRCDLHVDAGFQPGWIYELTSKLRAWTSTSDGPA
ncbi:hypothetical protein ACWD7F_34085 [Streptomyces sp. NPDC005122]